MVKKMNDNLGLCFLPFFFSFLFFFLWVFWFLMVGGDFVWISSELTDRMTMMMVHGFISLPFFMIIFSLLFDRGGNLKLILGWLQSKGGMGYSTLKRIEEEIKNSPDFWRAITQVEDERACTIPLYFMSFLLWAEEVATHFSFVIGWLGTKNNV